MPRLLMLHGWGQNALQFRKQTSVLRKRLAQHGWECCYVDARQPMNPELSVTDPDQGFSWWRYEEDSGRYEGWEDTIRYLGGKVKDQYGSVDAILGFSQGGILASLLCRMWQQTLTDKEDVSTIMSTVRKCIIVGAFKSRSHDHQKYFDDRWQFSKCPTLHVVGMTDKIIAADLSLDLASKYFQDPQLLQHDGGHYIPQKAEHVQIIVDFLQQPNNQISAKV